jgi:ABC-type glycerol-3-phosphate transport system substrate-binding protein
MGYDHYYLGPELEFFYFKNAEGTEPLDRGGFFDLTTLWAENLQKMVAKEINVDEGLDAMAAEMDKKLAEAGLG